MTEEIKKTDVKQQGKDEKKEEEASSPAPKKIKKKAKRRHVAEANVYIQVTFNNTIVTITDMKGDTVAWASSGSCGFKGTRKATPYAASVAVETAMNKAKALGVEKVHIIMKGIGSGRDQSLRTVNAADVAIESISDVTAIPHNGCRPRKTRRV